MQTQSIEQN